MRNLIAEIDSNFSMLFLNFLEISEPSWDKFMLYVLLLVDGCGATKDGKFMHYLHKTSMTRNIMSLV